MPHAIWSHEPSYHLYRLLYRLLSTSIPHFFISLHIINILIYLFLLAISLHMFFILSRYAGQQAVESTCVARLWYDVDAKMAHVTRHAHYTPYASRYEIRRDAAIAVLRVTLLLLLFNMLQKMVTARYHIICGDVMRGRANRRQRIVTTYYQYAMTACARRESYHDTSWGIQLRHGDVAVERYRVRRMRHWLLLWCQY